MIAIIGGGISGLTLAYYLQKNNKPYVLLEADAIFGGCIQTNIENGVIAEKGPNSILANDFVFSFLKGLNLTDEIVIANSTIKKRFVYKGGKYRTLPSGPIGMLFGSFFSVAQRINIFKEFSKKQDVAQDITLDELIRDRFGAEVADYVLDPFVSGIYAGNSKELIAELCFPVLINNIAQYGSVLKGFMKNPPKRKITITFRKGLSQLIDALTTYLTNIKSGAKVTRMNKEDGKWNLTYTTAQGEEFIACEQVVMAIPAYRAAPLIHSFSSELAELLEKVEYPMVHYAHFLFHKKQVNFDAEGFGALHPSKENLLTAGVIWNSSVFKGRTSDDMLLMTCMVNEKRTPHLRSLNQQEIKNKLVAEITMLYQVDGNPVSVSTGVWDKAIPQYDIHMRHVKDNIDSLAMHNVHVLSNWPNGISIADCICNANSLSKIF